MWKQIEPEIEREKNNEFESSVEKMPLEMIKLFYEIMK